MRTILLALDKLFIIGIALEQLVLSVFGIWSAFMIPYGGGYQPLLGAYAAWGLISAFTLFSGKALSRTVALPWHAIFVGYVLVSSAKGLSDNPTDRAMQIVAFCDLFVVFYLTRTALAYFRNQTTKPQSPAEDPVSRDAS